MSVLTDVDIRSEIDNEALSIEPFSEDSLTPVGYDLRVGTLYASAFSGEKHEIGYNDSIIIEPGDTSLIVSLEAIGMPANHSLTGLVFSKVSKSAKGLSHTSTSIDPDWSGRLLVAVHNHSIYSVKLKHGEPFCTIIFFTNRTLSKKPSNKHPNRAEVLTEYATRSRKVKNRFKMIRLNRHIFACAVVILCSISGLYFFGSSAGMVATTGMGVGLSSIIINRKIDRE